MNAPTSAFDLAASRERCKRMRRRILAISQTLPALHISPAFSCLEILDIIYFGLMRRGPGVSHPDTFILSKGHGAMAQYAVLHECGVLTAEELDSACKPGSRFGGHPDRGLPGVEASTGSLGHGLPIAIGLAYADKIQKTDRAMFVVISDGELMEGSIWESLLLAPNLALNNLVVFVDLNDLLSRGQFSQIHPHFYPVVDKVRAFGWETAEADGHDPAALYRAVQSRQGKAPLLVVAQTVKGKGVSFMENQPIWHFRSPSPEEYQKALKELT